jgi:hypothetical protein
MRQPARRPPRRKPFSPRLVSSEERSHDEPSGGRRPPESSTFRRKGPRAAEMLRRGHQFLRLKHELPARPNKLRNLSNCYFHNHRQNPGRPSRRPQDAVTYPPSIRFGSPELTASRSARGLGGTVQDGGERRLTGHAPLPPLPRPIAAISTPRTARRYSGRRRLRPQRG